MQQMPTELPDVLEAGTLNVPGIAGLAQGIDYVRKTGLQTIARREHQQVQRCAKALNNLGFQVFSGQSQSGTISFVPDCDCEEFAQKLAAQGIAVRAGLHCAPTAHESAGTLESGTVRVSFGRDASDRQTDAFLDAATALKSKKYL